MMVANSFDLWQKDAFFSAAEGVQESADIMESAYRMWIRKKRDGLKPEDLDELSRELQTALGTAKWQLEEFERAVRLSHGHRADDITASRHKQFIAAIESQISHVEATLREAFSEEGKQPLRWVNLNKAECDDLAMFLSGTPQTPQFMKEAHTRIQSSMISSPIGNHYDRKDADRNLNAACSIDTSDEKGFIHLGNLNNTNRDFIINMEAREISGIREDMVCQGETTTSTRKTWSSPNFGALKIVIADEDEQKNKLLSRMDATPKEKGSKPLFWKQKCGEHFRAKGSINVSNQLFGQVFGLLRQSQTPLYLQFSCSTQLALALMLSIFLIGTECYSQSGDWKEAGHGEKLMIINVLPPAF